MKQFVYSTLSGFALLTALVCPSVSHAEVILVGSSNIHFSEISKTKLRDLFTGQSQVVGESPVLVIDRDEGFGDRGRFISDTLGFTTEEFKTVQRLLECIGISKAPTVARDSQHMVELLANNPNALGYLTRKELQGNAAKSKLRQIRVLAE